MAANKSGTCYQDSIAQGLLFYLEQSLEHQDMQRYFNRVLPAEFKRIGEGKSSLDVLGVGSGGGQMDVHLLTLLQATFPGVPITSDVVEGSVDLTNYFRALLAKTDNLQTVPFSWHIMTSEDYIKQTKAKGDMKKFDFIHLIQMIYYVDDMAATIKFYHGLLKRNGRLMIIVVTAKGGWYTMWKTLNIDVPSHTPNSGHCSSAEVRACLDKLGLKYDEHHIPSAFDISECFDPNSKVGHKLLNFFTAKDNFYTDFTPEARAAILDLLKNKCSSQKDGKTMFNTSTECFLVHA